MLKINYFASVREQLGVSSEQLELPAGVNTAGELANFLATRGSAWQLLLSRAQVLMAVNQAVCSGEQALAPDDEVAFFPPMTGG